MSRRLFPVLAAAVVIATCVVGSPASASRSAPDFAPRVSVSHAKHALSQVRDLLSPGSRSASGARTAPQTRGDVTLALRDLALARDSLTGADRRAADAYLARPTVHTGSNTSQDGDEDVFDYSADEGDFLQQQCSTHFCVTYTTAPDAGAYVNSEGERLDNRATSAEAQTDLSVLEHVYSVEIGSMRFRTPVSDAATVDGSFNNANGKIDIYLTNVGVEGIYGYCAVDDQTKLTGLELPAYCVLDNDFAKSQFGGVAPARSRDVTAAHEFFHAIQYAYNVDEDSWFMEGSAVWMEDEVYNSINDYLQFVPASPIRRPLTPFNTDGSFTVYGDFSLFKFLSSYLRTKDAVRQAWLAAAADGTRLGSLKSVEHVLTTHHRALATAWSTFGLWNTLPPGTYPERVSYRPAGAWHAKTLSTHSRTAGTWKVALKALANAPVSLTPGSSLSKHSKLRVTVNAPDVSSGGAATLQVRYRNGHVSVTKFGLDRHGDRTRTVTFNPKKLSTVVIVLSNTSTSTTRTFTIHAHAS